MENGSLGLPEEIVHAIFHQFLPTSRLLETTFHGPENMLRHLEDVVWRANAEFNQQERVRAQQWGILRSVCKHWKLLASSPVFHFSHDMTSKTDKQMGDVLRALPIPALVRVDIRILQMHAVSSAQLVSLKNFEWSDRLCVLRIQGSCDPNDLLPVVASLLFRLDQLAILSLSWVHNMHPSVASSTELGHALGHATKLVTLYMTGLPNAPDILVPNLTTLVLAVTANDPRQWEMWKLTRLESFALLRTSWGPQIQLESGFASFASTLTAVFLDGTTTIHPNHSISTLFPLVQVIVLNGVTSTTFSLAHTNIRRVIFRYGRMFRHSEDYACVQRVLDRPQGLQVQFYPEMSTFSPYRETYLSSDEVTVLSSQAYWKTLVTKVETATGVSLISQSGEAFRDMEEEHEWL